MRYSKKQAGLPKESGTSRGKLRLSMSFPLRGVLVLTIGAVAPRSRNGNSLDYVSACEATCAIQQKAG